MDCAEHRHSDDPPHTVWIALSDRLPRKYVEGSRDHPTTIVTYFDYGQVIAIVPPPSDKDY